MIERMHDACHQLFHTRKETESMICSRVLAAHSLISSIDRYAPRFSPWYVTVLLPSECSATSAMATRSDRPRISASSILPSSAAAPWRLAFPPEGSYRLSDHFIQRIEACRFVTDVQRLTEEINDTYFSRIHLVQASSGMSRAVHFVSDYVENHVLEKIGLEDIAKGAGYSEYYLSRKFRQETGKSLTGYIQERKIEYAKRKLIESPASIADLSEELSFSSPSYFSAVFRRFTGQSPLEYIAGGKK